MTILTLFFALLLSGASGVTAHTDGVSGGGPISGPQAAASTGTPPTSDSVSGGGPTT